METLKIASTERTPEILFDYINHRFVISGEAYPENSEVLQKKYHFCSS